jgi:hypothetical protein
MRSRLLVGRRELRCDPCRWRLVRRLWHDDSLDACAGDEPRVCPWCGHRLTETVYDRQARPVLDASHPQGLYS